jgi:hypothetical protein
VSLGSPRGRGLAVMDASFEEVINEVLLAKETAGEVAQETGAALATPSVKTAGFAADFGQLVEACGPGIHDASRARSKRSRT